MRKAAFILNIIDAVATGIASLIVLIAAVSFGTVGGSLADNTANPEETQIAMNLASTIYWVIFVVCLIGLAIQIIAAVANKKAVSKNSVVAPAILSIIFGGILGIIAGILLLVANDQEYATSL